MKPQEIRTEAGWVPLGDFLRTHVADLVPLSVGRCFRFRLGKAALEVRPLMDLPDVLAAVTGDEPKRATAYKNRREGVIVVLPEAIAVEVTFDGDQVLKAAALVEHAPAAEADVVTRDDVWGMAAKLLKKGALKLEPYQEKIAAKLERGGVITIKTGVVDPRPWIGEQIRYYAKHLAFADCGLCGGHGIAVQAEIDGPGEPEFCRECHARRRQESA